MWSGVCIVGFGKVLLFWLVEGFVSSIVQSTEETEERERKIERDWREGNL